jgi:hypothetical protein
MSRRFLTTVVALLSVAALPMVAVAAEKGGKSKGNPSSERRGGYSYTKGDTINTYGDSRGQFGRSDSLRDPSLGTQTNSGPFDHGFFYNSGIGLHGGDAPFLR